MGRPRATRRDARPADPIRRTRDAAGAEERTRQSSLASPVDDRRIVLRRPIELAIDRPPDAVADLLVQPDELHGERVVTRDVKGFAVDERPSLAGQVDLQPGALAGQRAEVHVHEAAIEREVEDAYRDVGDAEAIALERTGDLPDAWRRVGFASIGHGLHERGDLRPTVVPR